MEWAQIRAEYERAFAEAKRRGITQTTIAQRSGLSGQNAISKVLSNNRRGPTVLTLTRAIEGLGLSVSEFFARVEQRERGEVPGELGVQGSYAKGTRIHATEEDFIIDTVIARLRRSHPKPRRRRIRHKQR